MARAGFCNQCGENVWLAQDGSCPRGHAADQISNVYEASPPAPQPQPQPQAPYVPSPAPYGPQPAPYGPSAAPYGPQPPKKSHAGVIIAIVAVILVGMLFICGILAAIAVPIFTASKASAQRRACFANQRNIIAATKAYEADHNQLPATLNDLVKDNLLDPIPVCPGGGTYEWDATKGQVSCTVHGSIGMSAGPSTEASPSP
jgi:competence protein ComGC